MMKSSYIIIDTYAPANDRVSVILELVIVLCLRSLFSYEFLLVLVRVAITARWYSERFSSLEKSSMTNEASGVGENFDEIVRADVRDTVGTSLRRKIKKNKF